MILCKAEYKTTTTDRIRSHFSGSKRRIMIQFFLTKHFSCKITIKTKQNPLDLIEARLA